MSDDYEGPDPEDFSMDKYREKIAELDAQDGIYWLDESPIESEREAEKKYGEELLNIIINKIENKS